jgi:hypothetical protein
MLVIFEAHMVLIGALIMKLRLLVRVVSVLREQIPVVRR